MDGGGGGIHPGRVTSTSQDTHTTDTHSYLEAVSCSGTVGGNWKTWNKPTEALGGQTSPEGTGTYEASQPTTVLPHYVVCKPF